MIGLMHVPRGNGRRGKRDGTHVPIVRALRAVGCSVLELHGVGGGCPDILAGRGGRSWLLEVKDPKGRDRVEPSQVAFAASWRGCPVLVVRSVAEALAAVGVPA